jgi:hypothetical protein
MESSAELGKYQMSSADDGDWMFKFHGTFKWALTPDFEA